MYNVGIGTTGPRVKLNIHGYTGGTAGSGVAGLPKHLIIGGPYNKAGITKGAVGLLIADYDNDAGSNYYPIYVEDENMKFLIDADLPRSLKQIFEKHDYDASDVRDIKLHRDEEIVKYAKRNKCIILTRDLGFGNMIEYPIKEHFGIIIFRLPF